MQARSIYRGRIVNLAIERVTLPNGFTTELEIIRHPGAAAVAAIDDRGRVLLLRQYRHAAGGLLWEVPAGTLEPGEEPLACARRELREEGGVEAAELVWLGSIFTCPGFCDEKIHLFWAASLSEVPRQVERDEVIETVVRVPLRQALDMIGGGKIQDAKSIAALYHASLRSNIGR